MIIRGNIDRKYMFRSAYVPIDFVATDCALALLMKALLPGIHVFDNFMGFCDQNGHEHTIHLPEPVQDWLRVWDRTKAEERQFLEPLSFKMEVPDKAIDAIGRYKFEKILKGHKNLRMEQTLVEA